jgi:hypothetical protein
MRAIRGLDMGLPVGSLAAPERINYFYGLLLDADRLRREQSYFNQKRWLLNRIGLGVGVVCGLEITVDSTNPAALTLGPGIAIDGLGRELINPQTIAIDASQLTDDSGKVIGQSPSDQPLLVSLAYAEKAIDPVPVLVADCEHPGNCAPASTQEGFAVLVRVASGAAPPPPPGTPLPASAALRTMLANIVGACSVSPVTDPSVPLARQTLPGGPLDAVSDRLLVYSNPLLFQLVWDLASTVSGLVGTTLLLYVSGDNQSAAANTVLPQPLIVALQDASGNPIDNGTVTFTVTAGGGSVTPTASSAGHYQTNWTLGASGAQTVVAKAAGTNLTVTFGGSIL